MKIAIIDCSVSGHRETYYKAYTRTWASLENEVLLIAPQESDTGDVATFSKIMTRPLLPLPVGKPIKKKLVVLKNALIRLQNLAVIRQQLKEFHPDLVYFPCLDDMLPTLAPLFLFDWLLPYSWSGLLVQSALPSYKPWMPDVRPFLRSRHCQGIGVLNEYSIDALKPFQPSIQRLPDFADLSEPAERVELSDPAEGFLVDRIIEEEPKGRKVIALLGSIDTRKGINLLLSVIPLLPEEEYYFLIAGKSAPGEIQNRLLYEFEEARTNCIFDFDRIPDEGCFNGLVAASDVIFAAYRNFSGSSNLLTKAAAFGKPVIVSQGGCMGKRVAEYGMGAVIPQDDTDACRQAIIDLCRQGAPNPQGFAKYAAEHSLSKLKDGLAAIQHKITANHQSLS